MADCPCVTEYVADCGASEKDWSVVVTVNENALVCVVPDPLALIVTAVPLPVAMLAAVTTVMLVVLVFVPSICTVVGLNAQVAPVGNPVVQLGVITWLKPCTGTSVIVIGLDVCPAITLVLPGAAASVKSGASTVTTTAADVEALFDPSPSYFAVTLFEPPGSAVVDSVAVPVVAAG